MGQSLPRGHLVGHEDLSDIDRRMFLIKGYFEGDVLVLCGTRIFVTFQRDNPQNECSLTSFAHLMTYRPFRRSLRKICQVYRKVKRSNCIVRCYLKTTEVVLDEVIETCRPFLGFPIYTIDSMLCYFMNYIDDLMSNPKDQFLPISRNYGSLIQMDLKARWSIIRALIFDSIGYLID
ncbi:hypothetical protein C0J52_24033 [Blattella germanica]|nr:hypothetical protein C0J52_24033 [Blattella germanica]